MSTIRRLLDRNEFLGLTEYHLFDEATEEWAIETVQDVEPTLDLNKATYNDAPTRWGDGRLVARIPMVVFQDLMKRGIARDPAALKRWLNDPDNQAFRLRPGTL